MSNSIRNSTKHTKLFIPGPVEVLPEILDAQANWMFGHRMPECAELIAEIKPKLSEVFKTDRAVLIQSGSGSGFWEGAIRNCVRKKVLHAISGAFGKKWEAIARANGVETTAIDVEWGQPVLPEHLIPHLETGEYDAVAFVHNETSTGITNPVQEIAEAIRALPNGQDITIMVDTVSGMSGAELYFDEWDLDIALCSSQKAFALPPGLGMCAVSERAMAKAATIENRGYYFDFLALAKSLEKDNTPNTSPIPMLFALNAQLTRIMEETVEGRWARHIAQRDATIEYFTSKGFELYGHAEYASPTVSNFANTLDIDILALNEFLRTKGMFLSNGYGSLKGKAFRVAHMGDITIDDLNALFAAVDEFLAQ